MAGPVAVMQPLCQRTGLVRVRADVAAAAKTVSALSRFIVDFESQVSEVEINPLAVLEQGSGCLALDAVIVTKGK
jgi:succinyl-CoA synthetase beta subunit